jgi:uncharacterized protein (DUF2249 family)
MNPVHPRKSRTLDVRPLLARGEEPFSKIIKATAALGVGESLLLVTPFLPSPLIEKLQAEGFSARPIRRGDGSWQTEFVRLPPQ